MTTPTPAELRALRLEPRWIFDDWTVAPGHQPADTDENPNAHGITADGGCRGFDHTYGDGYDFLDDASSRGWAGVSSWGADGWDLGDWPYVVHIVKRDGDRYALIVRCEGDLTGYIFDTRDAFDAHLDAAAAYWWNSTGRGPTDTDRATRPAADFTGAPRRLEVTS